MAHDDVVSLFIELAAIPSPPGEERAVADRVAAYLRDLGLDVDEDDAGARIGSDAGNLYARLEPTTDGGTPLFLCAHLDTVPPDGPIEPVVEDGVVRNAAGTILGADNKAAVAVDARGGAAAARREPAARRHRARCSRRKEEVGLLGAAAFDHDAAARAGRLRLRPGGADRRRHPRRAARAPIEVRFHGRAAHAGMYPEEGRSAIAAAARRSPTSGSAASTRRRPRTSA